MNFKTNIQLRSRLRSRIQKSIAIGVMTLGALLGFWISSSSGPWAQAQMDGSLPPPDAGFPPPEANLPPPDQGLPPNMGSVPMPEGGMVPPAMPEQDPSGFPGDEGGLQMQIPDEFNFKPVSPEGFIYNPEGLRDPFIPIRKGKVELPPEMRPPGEVEFNPQDPLQAFSVSEYKLVGVLWDARDPRAMVRTPEGKVYTIRKKIRLGREGAVVAAIRESEIVVVEPNPDGTYVNASTRIITMKK